MEKDLNMAAARQLIDKYAEFDVLDHASVGMYEDWFWTGITIWEGGQHAFADATPESDDAAFTRYRESRNIEERGSGIVWHSRWATPCIWIVLKDGTNKIFECYTTDVPDDKRDIMEEQIKAQMESSMWASGCLSQDVQDRIPTLEPFPQITDLITSKPDQ